jgi:rhodanese-related sulfurtransferase
MLHSPRFLDIVNDAKSRIQETTVDAIKARLDAGESFLLLDVREESEWARGHVPGATYLGKGVIERDIEDLVPDIDTEIVMYCGGGYRSALTADTLQKMGYTNAVSMNGGFRGWKEAGYPIATD